MKLLLSFALMLCGLAVQGARFSPMQAVDLQCEYLTTPLGIDVAEPRLMWKLQSPVGGVSQSAYRVVVATSPEQLEAGNADVWNSGRIKSGDGRMQPRRSAEVAYPLLLESRNVGRQRPYAGHYAGIVVRNRQDDARRMEGAMDHRLARRTV